MAILQSGIVMLIFIGALVPNMKIAKYKQYNTNTYLNVSNSNSMKGISAILIFLSHFVVNYKENYAELNSLYFLKVFIPTAYLIVGLFFFYSGYGLFYSLKNKKDYLDKFLLRRFPSIIIPFVIITLSIDLIGMIMNHNFYVPNILLSFCHNWFMFTIACDYLIFYISFKFKFKNSKTNIVLFSILYIVFNLVIFFFVDKTYWIYSTLGFPLGMIWCQYKDKIDNQIKNKYIISLLIAIVLFAFSIAIKFFGDHFNCYGVELFGNIISVPFFITLVLIALNKVQINNKITNFLGKISLEIYLIHGNIIRLLSKFDMFVNNILLFFVVAVALFVLLAFIANLIDKKLLKWFIKLTIKKDKDLTKI